MNPPVCTCHGFPEKVCAKCGSKNPPFPVFCCQNQMLPPLGTFFSIPLGVSKNKISSSSPFLGRSDKALVSSSSSSFFVKAVALCSGGYRHGGGNTVGCWLGPGGNPEKLALSRLGERGGIPFGPLPSVCHDCHWGSTQQRGRVS